MTIDDNRVVKHFRAHYDSPQDTREETTPVQDLPKIRRKDIWDLNELLLQGSIPEEFAFSLKLLAFNFRCALSVCKRKADRQACARTFLQAFDRCGSIPDVDEAEVWDAIGVFDPAELSRLGHRVAMEAGRLLWKLGLLTEEQDPLARYKRAAEFLRKAIKFAEHLPDDAEAERRLLCAKARVELSDLLRWMDDLGSSEIELAEALELVRQDPDERDLDSALLEAAILKDLVSVTSQAERVEGISKYRDEAVPCFERLFARTDLDDCLRLQYLKQLSEVYGATKQYAAATDTLRQARDILQQLQAEKHVPLMEELDLLRRIISLLEKTGPAKEVHNLKESALAEFGVGFAGLLGYEDAVDVCRLADPFWMRHTIRDYAEKPECLPSLPREHMQLLFAINVDRELVRRIVEECREIAGSNYQIRVDAMQATELGAWTDRAYWERLAEFYQCVSTLQGIAERITEKRYQTSDDNDWHDYLGFPDFRLADVKVLEAVLARGAHCRNLFVAGSASEGQTPWFGVEDTVEQELCGDAQVNLCVCRTGWDVSQDVGLADWEGRMAVLDHLIWRLFGVLIDGLAERRPVLSRCRVPKYFDKHLDYLLGEREEDTPICDTYYFAPNEGQTCRREICKKNFTRSVSLERQLWRRAETLAERVYQQSPVRRRFDGIWTKAKSEAKDPKEALLHFKRILK